MTWGLCDRFQLVFCGKRHGVLGSRIRPRRQDGVVDGVPCSIQPKGSNVFVMFAYCSNRFPGQRDVQRERIRGLTSHGRALECWGDPNRVELEHPGKRENNREKPMKYEKWSKLIEFCHQNSRKGSGGTQVQSLEHERHEGERWKENDQVGHVGQLQTCKNAYRLGS